MTEVTLLVGVAAVLGTLVLQHIAGPLLSTWYQERLYRARSAIERRHDVRRMIENELEKGFEDLSALRALLTAVATSPAKSSELALRFLPNFAANDQKWGVWRPYLIQDHAIEQLCEEYRMLIKDLRIEVIISTNPLALKGKVAAAELDMAKKSHDIVAEIEERNW